MSFRPLRMLLAAMVVVLLAGAVVTAEVARRSGDGMRPCHTDVRCSGQSLTTATGPLAPPESLAAIVAIAVLAAGVTASASFALHDRLSASRLFRPPRLAA